VTEKSATMEETSKEKAARLKKALAKKEGSLPILLMDSELYDYNPGAMMVLMVIALGQRTNLEAYFPEDCPYTKDQMLGWCDRAEWGIALRAKKSESQVQKDIRMFREDGVIEVRTWVDSNNTVHNMYRINADVVKENQRPSRKRGVKRPSRYKAKRGANKGSFSSANQPGRGAAGGFLEEED
jgi:hypothetical protein